MKKNNYSVVIVVDRPDRPLASLLALGKLGPTERPKEVFVCVGHNPSSQRNLGVKACSSPLVYFLDDDSRVIEGTVERLVGHFSEGRTAVTGGPNLPLPGTTGLERTISAVLASWMGSFSVRNRYASLGSVKEATEKDLILCNMMVHRSTFLKEGGFRKDLYPNEENEFLNRLLHSGYRLVYDPSAAVYRPRRKSLWAFCYQAFRYGRGRARQMKVYPCLSDIIHLAPAFFLFYLATLGAALVPPTTVTPWNWVFRMPIWWVPLGIFLVASLGTGISAASWHRRPLDALLVPFLILLRHAFYGLGLIAGFFTGIPAPPEDVTVYKASWNAKGFKLKPVKTRKP